MESNEKSYCRLCAQLKHSSKLLNLQVDEIKRREVVEKLNQVNVDTNLYDDLLPKTICFKCINSLDRAFQFVLCIKQAQDVLSEIFLKQIKVESQEFDDDNDKYIVYDSPDDCKDFFDNAQDPNDPQVDVKVLVKEELAENIVQVKSEIKKNKRNVDGSLKKTKDLSLDALPLSQLKLTWKDYNWTCSYCGTQFPTIDELRTHSMQYHNSCSPYRCTDCNMRQINLARFVVHVKRHRRYLKLSCYKCHKRFSTSHKLSKHAPEHKVGLYYCKGCFTTFSSDEELNNHLEIYYRYKYSNIKAQSSQDSELSQSTSAEDLTCLSCNKTFKYRSTLNTHLLIHTERKRDYTCDKCGKCFLNKQNLIGHMVVHDNVRPHQCEICKATFKTHNQLKYHVGVHDNKKPFACEQCGRCFRLNRQLTSHKIIHTDALPYVCSFCDKRFRFRTILNQHIRQHTGVKPYSCQICQRDFTNWPNFNKHMKRRHGMDMAKKKHTPDGVYPIDQNTGEVIVTAETAKLLEWKKQMMSNRKPGRPKFTENKSIDEKSHQNEEDTISLGNKT